MRIKRNRKLMSILLTLSLLVTLLVPMVGPAAAASSYTMSNTTTVTAGGDVGSSVGTLAITGDSTFAVQGKYVYLTLPSDPSGYGMNISVTNSVYANGNLNALQNGDITVAPQGAADANGAYRQYKLTIATVSNSGMDASITVHFDHLYIPSGATGVVTLSASAPSSSTFTSGSIDIAKVSNATVALSVESVPSFGSAGDISGVIDVKEANKGGLTGSPMLKFKLPPGFSWDGTATMADHFTPYWGKYYATAAAAAAGGAANQTDVDANTFKGSVSTDGRTLSVDLNNTVQNPVNSLAAATYWSFAWKIKIEDDSVAQQGDITVDVSGDSSASPTSLVVGHYGEEGLTMKAVGDPTTLIAGKTDQKLGKIEVDENLKGSLINNRTITLALPANVKWYATPNIDADLSNAQAVTLDWSYSGSDAQTLKGTLNVPAGGTTDIAKLVFKDLEVTPSVDFTGDINVTVGGSMGMTGTFKLATCNAAVTATTASAPDVKLGLAGQAAADVTITEAAAGNLDGTVTVSGLSTVTDDKHAVDAAGGGTPQIVLKAPAGVTFTTTPTVAVTDGNLQLDTTGITTSTTSANEGLLYIPIKGSSTTASTIKISGIQLTVDRTVPEGPLQLKVQGTAIDETTFDQNAIDNTVALYPNSDTAAKVTVANVSTPAPTDQKATAVFKIGDTNFTLNGVAQTMDAAPYLKNDRTYLPIRFVAQAVGVSDNNIIWNSDDQSVTLIKNGSVVRLVVGSTTMTINGTPIIMDTAPEIVDPGRTMLPVSWVAKALGANIQWDPATQSVTVN